MEVAFYGRDSVDNRLFPRPFPEPVATYANVLPNKIEFTGSHGESLAL